MLFTKVMSSADTISAPPSRPIEDVISSRTGIIKSVSRIGRGSDEPNPPVICQAVLSHFDFRTAKLAERGASGKGETEQEARMGAIGEAVERYCAGQFAPASLSRASAAELGPAAIRPEEFVLYSATQYESETFRYVRPNQQTPISWVRILELPARSPVLAPAALVYLHYTGERGEEFFTPPTSNGLAAGPDLASAILGGLRELIERDAFLITWMNRLPAPRVDYSSLQGIARHIRAHYAQFGVEALVFNLTWDIGVPVMMAMALDRSGKGPSAVVGLGCDLDPTVAVKKALMEVCQVRPSESRKFLENQTQARLHSYSDIRMLEDHAGFAAIPANLAEFAFLLDNGKVQRLEDLASQATGATERDLDWCVEALRRAGCRVAYADLTTPDIEPFGMRVVRAIATGLQPIHFGYGEERLGGRRLFDVPWRVGVAAEPRSERDLNPCPHPLA